MTTPAPAPAAAPVPDEDDPPVTRMSFIRALHGLSEEEIYKLASEIECGAWGFANGAGPFIAQLLRSTGALLQSAKAFDQMLKSPHWREAMMARRVVSDARVTVEPSEKGFRVVIQRDATSRYILDEGWPEEDANRVAGWIRDFAAEALERALLTASPAAPAPSDPPKRIRATQRQLLLDVYRSEKNAFSPHHFHKATVDALISKGLLKIAYNHLRLTKEGRSVALEFLSRRAGPT